MPRFSDHAGCRETTELSACFLVVPFLFRDLGLLTDDGCLWCSSMTPFLRAFKRHVHMYICTQHAHKQRSAPLLMSHNPAVCNAACPYATQPAIKEGNPLVCCATHLYAAHTRVLSTPPAGTPFADTHTADTPIAGKQPGSDEHTRRRTQANMHAGHGC